MADAGEALESMRRYTVRFTLAVRYGYLNGGVPETWGADAVVDCPQDVIAHL